MFSCERFSGAVAVRAVVHRVFLEGHLRVKARFSKFMRPVTNFAINQLKSSVHVNQPFELILNSLRVLLDNFFVRRLRLELRLKSFVL